MTAARASVAAAVLVLLLDRGLGPVARPALFSEICRVHGVRKLPRADLRALEEDADGQRRSRSEAASRRHHPGPVASPIRW